MLVALHVSGPAGYAANDISTSFTTLEDTPPSGNYFGESHGRLEPGQKSTLTVSTGLQCAVGARLLYRWLRRKARSPGTTFETNGVQIRQRGGPRTAQIRDDHGHVSGHRRGMTATATTNAPVIRKPPEAFHFTDLLFGKNDTAVSSF